MRQKNIISSYIYRTFIVFLALFLGLTLLSIPAYGASAFTDVSEKDYYYDAVQEMYDKGYVKGYGDGYFKPQNNITIAESLTILFRLSGVTVEEIEAEPTYWYSNVIGTAKRIGLISENVNPNAPATRLDIAKYIVKLYQIDMSATSVENVFMDTNLLVANTMYQYGIFIGTPIDGTDNVNFNPTHNITRGDLSLVLYRLNDKIDSPYVGNIKVGSYEVRVNPETEEDYLVIMKALGESGELSIVIPYSKDLNNLSYYLKIRQSAISAFEKSFSMYPEYFSFTPTLNIKREIHYYNSGAIILTLSNNDIPSDEVLQMRGEFNLACYDIVQDLYAYEVLREDMSDIDKAKVFYEYVVLHCRYDLNYGVNSYTGYGAAIEKLAVCQGYTAMFNNLCRIENMDVKAISGVIIETQEPHIWSSIYLPEEDITIYCDVTFGDPILGDGYEDNIDLNYFNIEYEKLMQDRVADWA